MRMNWLHGGIETSIVVPGAFTSGTNHFANAGSPDDKESLAEYESGASAGLSERTLKGLEGTVPDDANPAEVAGAIVKLVNLSFGKRPLRLHIDPAQDGAEIVDGVADHIRAEFLRRIGLADLLSPAALLQDTASL
jgi:hypothetical protein